MPRSSSDWSGGALVINGAIESYYSYYDHREAAVAVQREKAQGAARVIEQFVREIESQLGWTTHTGFLPSDRDLEQRRFDFLRLLRQAPAITEVSYVDASGKEQLKVSRLAMDSVGSGIDFNADPKFREAKEKRRYLSTVYFRKDSEPYLTLSVAGPMRNAGVTVAEVNLKFIWDVISRIKVGTAGVAYVVDGRGLLIAHPDIGLVLRKTDLSQLTHVAAARAAGPDDDLSPLSRDLTGREVLTAFASIDSLGWLVFVDLPVGEAFRPLYASLLRSGGVLLLGLLLAGLAGLWLAQRMVVPIRALAAGATRIGTGDLDHRIELSTGDEVETLARGFNDMGARLKESYATLESKVEQRTRELSEALAQQTATADVLQIISRSPFDLEAVLNTLVESAARLCEADSAWIFRRDGGVYRWAASFGHGTEQHQRIEAYFKTQAVVPGRGSLVGRTALEAKPVQIADVFTDPDYNWTEAQRLGGYRTTFGVPLLREGAPVGVLCLTRSEVRPFSDKQIALAATFADQAVIAIENVRLFEEVQERTRQMEEALEYQTATAEVLNVISRSPTQLQPVLDAIVATAARLCDAEFALVYKEHGGAYHMAASNNAEAEFIRYAAGHPIRPDRGSLIGRTALERRPVHLPDCLADPEFTYFEYQRIGKYRSMLGVPLLREGVPIGVIGLMRTTVKPFTGKQIELVTTFADQAVIAIENTRLFEEVQERTKQLQEALDYQTASSEVLSAISRSPTAVQPVFDTIVESAARLCGALFSNVQLFDGRYLHVVATHNYSSDALVHFERLYPMPPNRSQLAGRAVLSRSAVHVPDVLADPEYLHEFAEAAGFRSMLSVPMLRERKPIGVITVAKEDPVAFSSQQVELLKTFADQAVIAIENTRLFEEVQERTRELEQALQQQTATADVLKTISRSAFDLQVVLDTLTRSAAQLCEAEMSGIVRPKDDAYYWASSYGFPPEFSAFVTNYPIAPGRETGVGRVLLEGRTVHIPDVLADPEYAFLEGRRLGGFRTLLAVPLLREGTPIGVIVVTRRTVQPFTDKQIELVTTFADQAVIAIENARLFDEVQARTRELTEALHQQTATADVLKTISRSTFDLEKVLDVLVETAVRLCEADGGTITRQIGGEFVRAGTFGFSDEFRNLVKGAPVIPDRGTVSGRALLEARVIRIRDARADPEYTWSEAKDLGEVRSALGVPLMREGAPIGVLSLTRRVVRPFTDKQAELAATFADQAVIAIENVRLFEEVQARTRELSEALEFQTATSEVLQVISRSPSELQPVLDAIVRTAARLCDAYDSIAMLRKGDWLEIAAHHGAIPVDFKGWRVNDGWVTGRAVTHGRPIHVEDLAAHPDEFPDGHAMASRLGHRTILAVPLMRGEEAIGALTIRRLEVRPFSDKQVSLLQTFADQAVIAIQNVRLFEEVQARTRELARSLDELKALSEVGQAISSTLDLTAVLDAILMHACRLADSGGGAIYVFDEARGTFELEAAYNMSQQFIEAVRQHPIRLGESLIGQCAERREAVQVEDLTKAPPHPLFAMHLKADVQALLAVPLLHQKKVIGALVVRRKRAGAFSDEVVRLLQSFASQSAIAIQNARLFREIEDKSRQLELASQHKSQFLANMSHELRTPLNAILGYAELMQDGVYGELSDKVKAVLERVQSNGKHLLGLINDVLDLSKIEAGQLVLRLEDYSMGQIVETIATSTGSLAAEKKIGLKVEVAPGLPRGFGDERRIAQVLLNLVGNAIKFTDEGEVRVSARADGDRFLLCVADTGPGIAASEQQRIFEEFHQVDSSNTKKKGGTGLGLAIARRIVEMHGGRLWVDSEPGKGARFYVDLPVRAAQEGRAA
jgi:GAF domain-containing protein/HAMP domain-containing protein